MPKTHFLRPNGNGQNFPNMGQAWNWQSSPPLVQISNLLTTDQFVQKLTTAASSIHLQPKIAQLQKPPI